MIMIWTLNTRNIYCCARCSRLIRLTLCACMHFVCAPCSSVFISTVESTALHITTRDTDLYMQTRVVCLQKHLKIPSDSRLTTDRTFKGREIRMAEKFANESTDQFLDRLAVTLNEGYKSLMVAFGLKAGLFKTLVDLSPTPKTTHEIADAAGLKERYVREWLGGMVVSGIVDIDADNRYHLPTNRVPAFKEGDMQSLCAAWCQGIPLLGNAYDAMLEAIKKDGPLGVPYSEYETFHEFETSCSILWFTNHLCQSFIKSHPVLHEGLEKGMRVLDLGCGRGYAGMNIALRYPNSTVTGLDIDEEAINFAREVGKQKGLSNLSYVCTDAIKMPEDWTDTFDFVFGYDIVHDVPRPDLVLDEVRRVLKASCTFSCIDPDLHTKHADNIEVPHAPTYYAFSLFHCLPVSYQFPGSLGLGACWGREAAVKFFKEHGFSVQAIEKQPGVDDLVHYWLVNAK